MIAVRVLYQNQDGPWRAESPDVPGWTASAATFEECRGLAEESVRFALDREDVTLQHFIPAPV